MTCYNKNDIFATASLGYAMLPNIYLYNKDDKSQIPIDLEDDNITSFFSVGKRRYIDYINYETKKTTFKTLSKKGIEIFKKEMWEQFNKYQTNNSPRYVERPGYSKRKILTEEEYYQSLYNDYKKIENGTLGELFRVERKMKSLQKVCAKYNLDYEAFYKRMIEEGEYVVE